MKNYIINTERIGLRNWLEEDLNPFIDMNQDEQVMEFFPEKLSSSESERFFRKVIPLIEERGYAWFAAEHLEDNAFMGFVGLSHPSFEADFTPCLEIGWRLRSEFWGQGLATEAAQACLDFAWEDLKEKEVYSFTAVLNKRSEKVMQKIGMERVGEFNHPDVPEGNPLVPHVLYKIENPNL